MSTRPEPEPVELPLIDLLSLVVREHIRHEDSAFVVQVGAHDGSTEDPVHSIIRRHALPALLVEPQPDAFSQLKRNYRDQPQVAFENCLVGRTDGEQTFYTVTSEVDDLPFWLRQSASLDRTVVSSALIAHRDAMGCEQIPEDHESLIREVDVPCMRWTTLFEQHDVQDVDLLVVDTMGFDFELLKLFPFDRVKPRIIHFEHSLLDSDDQWACLNYLSDQGYSLAKVGVDTIACLDVETRRWSLDSW